MSHGLSRRRLLAGASAVTTLGALGGCAGGPGGGARTAGPPLLSLEPLVASPDRISDIQVCLRPFREQGPCIEAERIGDTVLVHNYGHGGSGWSLSWGAGEMATALAMPAAAAAGTRDVAVIGCGAIGLTTAVLLQRAGARVTILARELPPDASSSYATGVWSPDSRICLADHATPAFKSAWERMTRRSFKRFQGMLGLPGAPVEWIDTYIVRPAQPGPEQPWPEGMPRFADLRRELTSDLFQPAQNYDPGTHPFGDRRVRRVTYMMFNIGPYTRMLMSDFLAMGGTVEVRSFHSLAEVAALPQRVVVNCTGYGAKALVGDSTLVPVRGQLARLPPQPRIGYGLYYNQASFVPRRDGLVFQFTGAGDYHGYGDANLAPDRAEAERAVSTIASLFPTPA